jgi:magnesium chelatase family protein
MLARCTTYVLDGVTAHPVTVECDIRPGLPTFTVLGLSDAAARDLRETVRAAILNSGYPFPQRRVTLNIVPAWLRRSAPSRSVKGRPRGRGGRSLQGAGRGASV